MSLNILNLMLSQISRKLKKRDISAKKILKSIMLPKMKAIIKICKKYKLEYDGMITVMINLEVSKLITKKNFKKK